MSRRSLAREVLAPDEYAEYEARLRMEPESRHATGLPRINSDGYDQRGESHGVPGHWDWTGGDE